MHEFNKEFLFIIDSYLKKHEINHAELAVKAGIKSKTRTIGRWLNNEQEVPKVLVADIIAINKAFDDEHKAMLQDLIFKTELVSSKINRKEFPHGQFNAAK